MKTIQLSSTLPGFAPMLAKAQHFFGASNDQWERRHHIAEVLSKLALVIAALTAIWQYFEAQRENRIERVMEYISRYEQGDVAQARRMVREIMRPYYKQFSEMDGEISEQQRTDIVLFLVEETPDDQLSSSLDTLVDFFDSMFACVEVGLCDRETVRSYFCPRRSRVYWDDFAAYFRERRINNADFAGTLEACSGGQTVYVPQ